MSWIVGRNTWYGSVSKSDPDGSTFPLGVLDRKSPFVSRELQIKECSYFREKTKMDSLGRIS